MRRLLHRATLAALIVGSVSLGAAQTDPEFHSCTLDGSVGYNWISGDDGHNISGGADVLAGGGFAVTRHLFLTANFMFDSAGIKPSVLKAEAEPAGEAKYYTTTFDPTYRLRQIRGFSPYVVGGFGWLRREVAFTTASSGSPVIHPGNSVIESAGANSGVFDAGLGLNYRVGKGKNSWMLYVEVRYFRGVAVNSRTALIPATFGVRW